MSEAHLRSCFGLRVMSSTHPLIRRLKRQHPGAGLHGNKLWKATYLLLDYLSEYPPATGCDLLELGCGWGLGGVYCADQFDARVIALDADESVLPIVEQHARLNHVTLDTICMDFADISSQDLAGFDTLIGTDICFWDSLVPVVTGLLDKALEAGLERIVLTDPGRPSFREIAEAFASSDKLDVIYTDWAVPEPYNTWGLVLDIRN